MDALLQTQLPESQRRLQVALVDDWYRAIAESAYVPFPASVIRQHLSDLARQAMTLLTADLFEPRQAEEIGQKLAGLHCLAPEVLGRTLELFLRHLTGAQPNLAGLLGGMAAGFWRQAVLTVLVEQEQIRAALVGQLRATELSLRQAQHELERRVEQRTAELASANEELRCEIAERLRVEGALRESEQTFRALAEQSPNLIFINQMGQVVYANSKSEELLGYQREEFYSPGFDVRTLAAPESLALMSSNFARHLSGEEVEDAEYTLLARDGRRVEVLIATKLIDFRGQTAILGIVTDITGRKQVERALQDSEDRYRILAELTSDFAYAVRVEPGGELAAEWVTEAHTRITGYTPQEAIEGNDWQLMIDRRDMPLAEAQLERVLAGRTDVAEYRIVTKQGETRWLRNHGYPVWDEDQGRVLRIYAAAQDITQERQAQEALQESEERWRSLVENAPDVVTTLDREGRILFMNRPLLAASVEQVLGTNVLDAVLPEHRDLVRQSIRQAFETGAPAQFDVPAILHSGRLAWFSARLVPLRREGRVVAVMVVARDITQQRQIEEMKDNLIRDVSHELRNPLAKMQMSLELLMELMQKDQIDRGRVTRIADVTSANAQRLMRTLEGILALSAMETGTPVYQKEPVRLRELIDEVILDMQPLAVDKGLELAADLPGRLPTVHGDRERLFRVLVNLIDNAIKFSEQGRVTVSARAMGQEIEVSVSDCGAGILPQNLERVFERFFQEHYSSPGVGVGLPICRRIVEAHGGRIWAESPGRGQGATISFRLPLGQE